MSKDKRVSVLTPDRATSEALREVCDTPPFFLRRWVNAIGEWSENTTVFKWRHGKKAIRRALAESHKRNGKKPPRRAT